MLKIYVRNTYLYNKMKEITFEQLIKSIFFINSIKLTFNYYIKETQNKSQFYQLQSKRREVNKCFVITLLQATLVIQTK